MTAIRSHPQGSDRSTWVGSTPHQPVGLSSFFASKRGLAKLVVVSTAICVSLVGGSTFLAQPAEATGAPSHTTVAASSAAKRPAQFGKVSAHAGPGVGQITFTWKHDGKNTTSYRLETALGMFSTTDSHLPNHGRHSRTFTISAHRRSFTMSAAQAAAAGASVGSGNHLYFRLAAINTKGTGTQIRAYPFMGGVMPRAAAPKSHGLKIRLASFNVRTAKATGDRRSWLTRRHDVAKEIKAYAPQVVALQELGPGRADGKGGSTTGTTRQTDSLLQAMKTAGASRYKLVRTTPYVEPGKKSGTQGARILYDSSRLSLLSLCRNTTGNRNYSSSCSINMPLLHGDSDNLRRRAAYAKFRNKATGKQFYVVSAHLDTRHSGKAGLEKTYNSLRANQASAVASAIGKINSSHLPVVFAGDMNSWQNIAVGNGPHDAMVAKGFYDTASAVHTVNLRYSTYNNFETTQKAAGQGFASRLDVILIHGATGASKFANVTRVKDSSRPSDHNMIMADTVL